ncbi:carboxypeptidase-like regulatory domain-containing protein [uncultured Flavobacterium sp.]|uniref:carboxypeptidase-like regulatory domain-containing protein n=1 Tax=uncultured Flavobacterium sp. TaxID=165435 RepID=UPI0030EC32F5|tara:strand:- start:154488 stop:155303 length:816 start_codon:yes stop_codon:yes gene_type:complete
MKNKLLYIFLLVSFLSFSQVKERDLIVGKIKSDSLDVENITVFNVSSNIGAVTDIDGKFSIKIREKDTLVIQGLAYLSTKYIVQKTDLEKQILEIYLRTKINELNEVEVSPYTLTGVLEVDTGRIKTYTPNLAIDFSKMKPKDIRETRVINTAMPTTLAQTPVNFLAIFGFIGKGIKELVGSDKKKISSSEKAFNEKRLKDVASKPFGEHMKEQFSNHFFVNQLKIKNEDIPMFLAFSETSASELVEFLKPEKHLKLIEYLISKAEAFKKL